MSTDGKLLARVERWKSDLIDLSLRNRLINFKPGNKSALKIVRPEMAKLFEKAVIKERTLTIVVTPHSESLDHETNMPKIKNNQVLVPNDQKEATEILNRLRLKARTASEEQGINTLFLAVGLLKWIDPDKDNTPLLAPIILVPVKLSRQNIASPHTISVLDEDEVINPALVKKMEDLRIEIPREFEVTDEPVSELLERLFAQIEKSVENMNGWEVIRESWLGLFSFNKLVMFKDLERYAELVKQSDVLRAVAEGTYRVKDESGLEIPHDLDSVTDPEGTYQVLDADSSQQEAILAVKKGYSIVIQGPPGTGKSQTIANIIAECLGQGKRVLFVSEKMAALEVVKRRLDQTGLGDFCLELHSKKTGKRVILDELNRLLEGERDNSSGALDKAPELSKLKSTRERLNSLVRAIHTKHGKIGLSGYEIHSFLSDLTDIDYLDFDLDNVSEMGKEKLDHILDTLGRINTYSELFLDYRNTVLNKFRLDTADLEKKARMMRLLEGINKSLEDLRDIATDSSSEEFADMVPLVQEISGVSQECLKRLESEDTPLQDTVSSLCNLCKKLLEAKSNAVLNRRIDLPAIESSLEQLTETLQTLIELLDRFARIAGGKTVSADLSVIKGLKRLCNEYGADILFIDHGKMLSKWEKLYRSWPGRLIGGYRKDCRLIRSIQRNRQLPDNTAIIKDLRTAHKMRRLLDATNVSQVVAEWDKVHEMIVALDRELSERLETATERITIAYTEAEKLLRLHDRASNVPIINETEERLDIVDWVERAETVIAEIDARIEEIEEFVDTSEIKGEDGIFDFASAESFFERVSSSAHLVDDWIMLNKHIAELKTLGMESFTDAAIDSKLNPAILQKAFLKTFYSRLLTWVYGQDELLKSFTGKEYERLASEFRQFDRLQIELARQRLYNMLAQKLPQSDLFTPESAEPSILRREIAKKRRNKPIRRLFSEIPNLLQVLKPCLMMSPLSVSYFIDPESIRFDVVVFDEASQIFPEDAVGAIMRASQVVMVGDSKQLPPTSFFKALEADSIETEEKYDSPERLESILDECRTVSIPSKSLLWHYRSRHEALIAFSNALFYENRLKTFPGKFFEHNRAGVELLHLPDAVYDRSRSRRNTDEANAVATLVMRHAHTHPDTSLGVVAFSEAQQMAILERIDELRKKDKSVESFFSEEEIEPFFVKNLENVQGDERDVMIFSIGYGRDSKGNLSLNFGPLNREGGERRMNVAITRARDKVVVVSSITHRDIPADVQSPGVRALRSYLKFALERGDRRTILEESETLTFPEDSIFAESVYEALSKEGLVLHKNVGCSDYKVDIAVLDPERQGEYLLGIECDGRTFVSSRTARDRDRLRKEVLERLGWRIVRVFSKDWIMNKEQEIRRIKTAVEDAEEAARKATISEEAYTVPDAESIPLTVGEESDQQEGINNYSKFTVEDFRTHYKAKRFSDVEGLVRSIVEHEAPLHWKDLVSRIVEIYNACGSSWKLPSDWITEKGNLSRVRLTKYVRGCVHRLGYELRGSFVWTENCAERLPRISEPDSTPRKAEYIPPEEIRSVVEECLKNSFTVSRDDLFSEVSRAFGYSRRSSDISVATQDVLQEMLKEGTIGYEGEKLRLHRKKNQ